MKERERVALAALLQSLERFPLRDAALKIPFEPQRDEMLMKVIREAEVIASRSEGETEGAISGRLEAVTHMIAIGGSEIKHERRFYPVKPLSLDEEVFPVSEAEFEKQRAESGFDVLWREFIVEHARLPRGDFTAYFDSLLYLLRKYAWCVPATGGVSLYDHTRMTAAIAVCLGEVDQFLLIEGGISGIQQFIYSPTFNGQELQDGMARRLRGRSFYLNLLVKTLADRVCAGLDLLSVNTLWAAGGHFLIVAPNTDAVRQGFDRVKREIQQWLWREYRGALGLTLTDLVATRDELRNFGALRERLERAAARRKLQQIALPLAFGDTPKDEAVWENAWVLKMGEEVCRDTGRDLFGDETEISFEAQADRDNPAPPTRSRQSLLFDAIGRALVSARTIQLRREDDWLPAPGIARLPRSIAEARTLNEVVEEVLIEFPGLNRTWLLSKAVEPRSGADLSLRIADDHNPKLEFIDGNTGSRTALGFEMMATAVKTETGTGRESKAITEFHKLAQAPAAVGCAEYLGALRMDVDDLGYLFTHGLPESDRSLAKVANLSQMFEWFFAGHLNTLVAGKNLYTTYAGGDDLFIVGAWNEALDLADEIQRRFRKLCGENPALHISAGLSLCKGKYPIGRAAEDAGDRLDRIAKTPRQSKIDGDTDKDALTFLERKISWKRWNEVHALGDEMIKAFDDGQLSRKFVYNLMELYHNHIDPRRDPSKGDLDPDFIWLPRFKYSLVRNVKDEFLRVKLIENIPRHQHYLSILAGYVLLKTRNRKATAVCN